jgi:hypothetical protein
VNMQASSLSGCCASNTVLATDCCPGCAAVVGHASCEMDIRLPKSAASGLARPLPSTGVALWE